MTVRMLALSLLLGWSTFTAAQAKVYYFGMLAPRGASMAQHQWQPWLDSFNQRLNGDSLVLVPLDLAQLQQASTLKELDFLVAPQSQFVRLDTTGWHWLATLQSQPTNLTNRQQVAFNQIGSTIWVKKRSPIRTLNDLAYYDVAAVDRQAFGGYLLVAQLLQRQGVQLSPQRLHFLGYPIERTLISLAADKVDAAIVPLCLMEEMAANGVLNLQDYRAINAVLTADSTLHCVSSTKTYPNWTLAATPTAPSTLVQALHQFLFLPTSQTNSQLIWLPVQSSQEVEQVFIELQQHPSQLSLTQQVEQWVQQHRWLFGLGLIALAVTLINYVWMSSLALRQRRKILKQHTLLQDYDKRLERNQRLSLMGEMSAGIAHELNQPLAVIQNYTQGALLRLNKGTLDNDAITFVLNNIASETQRGANIIQNIRQWYATQPNTPSTVDVFRVIEQAKRSLGAMLTLQVYFQSTITQLYLPAFLLDQLMINTLLNAQQQGATMVWLTLHPCFIDDQPYIGLQITDDGGGFNEGQLAHIEQNKTQSQPRPFDSTKPDGMGMGLLICQRLCQSVGGFMTLDNVELTTWLATNTLAPTQPLSKPRHQTGAHISCYLPQKTTSHT